MKCAKSENVCDECEYYESCEIGSAYDSLVTQSKIKCRRDEAFADAMEKRDE
jgi:hypothetical protein